jgi:hypothetical protein
MKERLENLKSGNPVEPIPKPGSRCGPRSCGGGPAGRGKRRRAAAGTGVSSVVCVFAQGMEGGEGQGGWVGGWGWG